MIFKTTFITIFILFISSCAHAKPASVCALYTGQDYFKLAIKRSNQAKNTTDIREQSRYAKEGIYYANLCLEKSKGAVGCLYYRAVNRGLELETRTVRVRKELKKMVDDFLQVIKINGRYDNGGAYMAMGYVYLKLPSLIVIRKDIKKDINKADEFAQKALTIAPHDPENLKLAGEIAYKKKDYDLALVYFKQALKAIRNLQGSQVAVEEMKKGLKKLVKKAKKRLKRRTSGVYLTRPAATLS